LPAVFPSSRARRFGAVFVALISLATLAGCTNTVQRITGWGPDAYSNFIDGCTTSRVVVNGKTQTLKVAGRDFCDCVYNDIADKTKDDKPNNAPYPVPWDTVTAYEDKQSNAKVGELPTPPANLTKAIDHCPRGTGPTPTKSSSTTTTTKSS
jgi:hypothetical protein